MQTRIADSAYESQRAIETGVSVVVGVNTFAERDAQETPIPLQRIDAAIEREQIARLEAFRSRRDAAKVEVHLDGVRAAARGTENLMPAFVEAVDAGATLGEICNVLREVFGVYRAKEVVA
jgi:methylmalonyl-CoA mutase N-terminal domain/subunit